MVRQQGAMECTFCHSLEKILRFFVFLFKPIENSPIFYVTLREGRWRPYFGLLYKLWVTGHVKASSH